MSKHLRIPDTENLTGIVEKNSRCVLYFYQLLSQAQIPIQAGIEIKRKDGRYKMARAFTGKEAHNLIEEYRSLEHQLVDASKTPENLLAQIRQRTQSLIGKGAFLPAGAAIAGGESFDLKDPEILELLTEIHSYIHSFSSADRCRRLYADVRSKNDQAVRNLSHCAGSLQWFFTSSRGKEAAEAAYDYLGTLVNGDFSEAVQSAVRNIESVRNTPAEDVLADFESNRSVYGSAVLSTMPGIVSAGSQIKEAETLAGKLADIREKITAASLAGEKDVDAIRSAAGRIIVRESLEILKDVPVDELNRDKSGIRVKTLRDYGFNTIADVYKATPANLESIQGISAEGAKTIKRLAEEYAVQARDNTKLRLSADDRTPDATALVTAIRQYRIHQPDLEKLSNLKNAHEEQTEQGLKTLKGIGNGISWFFSPPEQRQAVSGTFHEMSALLSTDFAGEAENLYTDLSTPVSVTGDDAWADFEANAIAYSTILETIVPDVLGNDDAIYGLPEKLARELLEEELFPAGLNCELRKYQEWGVRYILHQGRVLLGDEMGLGKTIQAIAAMVSLRNSGCTHFMVVCPASVLPNWCKEIGKKSSLFFTKIHGQNRAEALSSWIENGGVAVTTYETTGSLDLPEDFRFDFLVVDEAHYIKNPDAQRTKNVKKLAKQTERILFMTGTALENRPEEMVSLIRILRPDIAAQIRFLTFMATAPKFRELIAPVYYRRKREDVLTELPELVESKEWCSMTPAEEEVYKKSVLGKKYADVRRVSWNMDDLKDSCKALRMLEIIEEAESEGRKIIVFSFFLDTIQKISVFLGSRCMPPINGSVPAARRQQIIDEFDEAPAGKVLLAQIQSGGTGLNIQSASVVILCEPQFKPSVENQAISRAYRMGQARSVLVYRLLCENSADEKITELLAKKQTIFDTFADESVAADSAEADEAALDDKTFGSIVQEEYERLTGSTGQETQSAPPDSPLPAENQEEILPPEQE